MKRLIYRMLGTALLVLPLGCGKIEANPQKSAPSQGPSTSAGVLVPINPALKSEPIPIANSSGGGLSGIALEPEPKAPEVPAKKPESKKETAVVPVATPTVAAATELKPKEPELKLPNLGLKPGAAIKIDLKQRYVERMAFSPDGRYLALIASPHEHVITLWDLQRGFGVELRRQHMPSSRGACIVSFSCDSKTLFTQLWGTCVVWDVETRQIKGQFDGWCDPQPWNDRLYSEEATPEGIRSRVRELSTGKIIADFLGRDRNRGTTSLSVDGKYFAVTQFENIHIGHVDENRIVQTFKADEPINLVEISPGGKSLLILTNRGIQHWSRSDISSDFQFKEMIDLAPIVREGVACVRFLRDGTLLFGMHTKLIAWDLEQRKPKLPPIDTIHAPFFERLSDGQHVISYNFKGACSIANIVTGKLLFNDPLGCATLQPKTKMIAKYVHDHPIELRPLSDTAMAQRNAEQILRPISRVQKGTDHSDPLISSHGKYVYDRASTKVFEVKSGKMLFSAAELIKTRMEELYVQQAMFAADESTLFLIGQLGYGKSAGSFVSMIVELPSGKIQTRTPFREPTFRELYRSPGLAHIVANVEFYGSGSKCLLMDADTAKTRKVIVDGGIARVPRASSDGKRLIFRDGKDGRFKIWDLVSGEEIKAKLEFSDQFQEYWLLDRGRRIGFFYSDGMFRVHDIETGRQVCEHDLGKIGKGPFRAGDVSLTTGVIAVADSAGSLHLAERSTGEVLATIDPKQQGIWRVSFSPDGKRLLTASQDGQWCFWEVDALKALEDAMNRQDRFTNISLVKR
jgi:WD40 repeat protein